MSNVVRIEWAKNAPKKERIQRVEEVRAIAYAALMGADIPFDAWAYYGELKYLQPKRATASFLEALVATCVVGRIRPSRTVRALQTLREIRSKAGKEDRFFDFERQLKIYLGTEGISNHGVGKQTFAGLDHQGIWAQIGSHISALNRVGYDVFLNSGTLLGVTRDGKLIDHDDDADLALVLKAGNVEEAIVEWKELRQTLEELGIRDHGAKNNPAIYKLKAKDGCEIDLFPAWIEDGKFHIYPHTTGNLDEADVLPLGRCSVSGEPIPAEPEKMLAVNYGAGWKEPDPYFKFNWLRARRTFSGFLEGL
ncbi:MAG: hypothetical protein ACU0BB_07660 [Paracoccaceae bacterium]